MQPAPDDFFIELGAGDGALTLYLLEAGARVLAIELDSRRARLLSERAYRYLNEGKLELCTGNLLDMDWRQLAGGTRCRLAGNLPYNIASRILSQACADTSYWDDAHFLVQKEMALRASARPGNRQWSRLGIAVRRSTDSSIVLELPPEVFSPPPKVQSCLLRLKPLEKPAIGEAEWSLAEQVARLVFSARRKSVRNSLKGHFSADELEATGLDLTMRGENIGLDELHQLAQVLAQREKRG